MDLWYSYITHDGIVVWGLLPDIQSCNFWALWISSILRTNGATGINVECLA